MFRIWLVACALMALVTMALSFNPGVHAGGPVAWAGFAEDDVAVLTEPVARGEVRHYYHASPDGRYHYVVEPRDDDRAEAARRDLCSWWAFFPDGLPDPVVGRVVHVVDGDTVHLRVRDYPGEPDRVVHFWGLAGPVPHQPGGAFARDRLAFFHGNDEVLVYPVTTREDGSLEAVVVEGQGMAATINGDLAFNGWAVAIPQVRDAPGSRCLTEGQAWAERLGRGLWYFGYHWYQRLGLPLEPWLWQDGKVID